MGLLSQANNERSMAVGSYSSLSQMAKQRDSTNEQLAADQQANQRNALGGAAAAGIQVGMATGNPLIGLGVGAGMALLGGFF